MGDKAIYTCPDEAELAAEFPRLYHFCMEYPVRRPQSPVVWERVLRVARVTKPILDQMRAEGLDVVSLENARAIGVDRLPLYRAVLDWLAEIRDPLSMTSCLCRLLEPEAAALLRRNRELLLRLAQDWNRQPDRCDGEMTLSALAQCVMKVARECDVGQIVDWARDCRIGDSAQFSYVHGLRPLVRKSGVARQTLIELIGDPKLGMAAVWVLAGAMKAEALPLLYELRQSSPDAGVRQAAADAARMIEARA